MGGSFIEHADQNPLEPAFLGQAIVCGPIWRIFCLSMNFNRRGAAVMAGRENFYE